jgi:hypothetical protein
MTLRTTRRLAARCERNVPQDVGRHGGGSSPGTPRRELTRLIPGVNAGLETVG